MCDPDMGIKAKGASLSGLENLSLAATVVPDFGNSEHTPILEFRLTVILCHTEKLLNCFRLGEVRRIVWQAN